MDLSLDQRQHRNAMLKEANRVVREQAAVNFKVFCAYRQFRKADPKDLTRLPKLKMHDKHAYYFTLTERLKPGEIQRTVLLQTEKFRWDREWLRRRVQIKSEGAWYGLGWWLSELPLPSPNASYVGERGYQLMAQWWQSNRKHFPWKRFPEELRIMILEFKEALEEPDWRSELSESDELAP